MKANEIELVKRLQSGDAQAFEALYASYGPPIYRLCHRLSASPADAEDLTQEVFLAAFQSRQRFQGRSSLTTWLYRIAVYQWRARCADRNNQTVPLLENTLGESAVNPIPDANERMALDWAMAALPAALRETFILVKAEGLTYKETAAVLDIPVGTAKYRVHEASERLRALLASAGDRDPSSVSAVAVAVEVVHEV